MANDGDRDGRGKPAGARRTQEDRSQETRRKAIDATIALVFSEGYAATTTSAVAKRAGISRGGMLHHFPTKLDLIEAVVRDVETRLRSKRRSAINQFSDPVERFASMTEATWETFQGEEVIALTEIMLAMRGDRALEDRLSEVISEMDRWNLSGTLSVANRAGVDQSRLVEAMHHLHYAAMRGLAIHAIVQSDREKLDDAFALLLWYKSVLTAAATLPASQVPPLPPQLLDTTDGQHT